jgi:ABC-type nitrate/sulfonate/bicarbonate transport system substrate-binding protein
MRRRFLLLATLASLATALAPSPALAQGKTIRLGIQPAPLLAAIVKEKQLLERRGYKPEWTVFQYAAPELEAMAAGSLDMAVMGTLPIVMVSVNNPDIWYVYDELGNGSGMVVAPDSGINGPADLRGKKIAFPGKGSQQYGLLMSYLGRAGVKESEVELFRANAPDMRTLLEKKQVHGFLAWAPFTSEAIRTGIARNLWTSDDLHKLKGGHWLNAGWAVRPAFARQSPEAVVDVIRALHEAARFLKAQPDEAAQVFARSTGLPAEANSFVIRNGYFVYFDPKDTAPSREALKQMVSLLMEHKVVKIDRNVDEVLAGLVHPEFVERALSTK